ncbi:copper homeostasis protein CutC [Paenibacillus sp. N3/727]|uniref:copper homeostasis protein CutC n=1 Tax=Paenibacillus sp. N3/727 TaxID=2925845 RepID=UPI001F53D792|nr:copper homeostasis protein CutC [Paenibacillus sp. N3/727]UNK17352.1 copper homeostasis protein CutC [Paenibacillus sp. N3/727]
MILEVIATTLQDALIAEECGADRIELITAVTEGGLTPSIGLIERVTERVNIPVNVMIRPHSRSFIMDDEDLETMLADITRIKTTGAAGIVMGPLTLEGTIDVPALKKLLAEAGPLDVTYHRAFDEALDQLAAYEVLSVYPQISRILTSGGPSPAPESVPQLQRLVERSQEGGPRILAGYGLTPEGILSFIEETGVKEVHFGSSIREGRRGLGLIDRPLLRSLADKLHQIN